MNIDLLRKPIQEFCRMHGVREFSLFGSVLREDFAPENDVDVLIALEPGRTMTIEKYLDMRDELSVLFAGREIDLVQTRLLKNPYRRHEILTTRKVLWPANMTRLTTTSCGGSSPITSPSRSGWCGR